jgi:AcrR family transcriptional regulator
MARPRGDIRTRVLHAGRKRFLLEGVDGASLRHIARDARTSIGMVYYYFPTKDDLFLGVVEEIYTSVLADLTQALDPALPVEERLLGVFTRIGSLHEDELLVVRLVLREALISSKRLDSIVERFRRGHIPLMIQLVMDGLAGGTFDAKLHPFVVVLSMMGLGGAGQLLGRAINERLPGSGIPTGEELSSQVLRVLLEGAGPQKKAV